MLILCQLYNSYRNVASILRANSANKFCVFFNYQNAKKMLIKWFIINAYHYIDN